MAARPKSQQSLDKTRTTHAPIGFKTPSEMKQIVEEKKQSQEKKPAKCRQPLNTDVQKAQTKPIKEIQTHGKNEKKSTIPSKTRKEYCKPGVLKTVPMSSKAKEKASDSNKESSGFPTGKLKNEPGFRDTPTKAKTSLKIITMNVNGKNDTIGNAPDRRRQAIQSVIVEHEPGILLLQEFKLGAITGKLWSNCRIPDNYEYTGHPEASIIYDKNNVTTIKEFSSSELDNLLRSPFPTDFTPRNRMRLVRIETVLRMAFICVSWHGQHSRLTDTKKVTELEYLLEYLHKLNIKYKLPILLGGDYNINIDKIRQSVKPPFRLHEYSPSERRKGKLIDFYIATEDIQVSNCTWVNLERDTRLCHPNEILDHDPVMASICAKSHK